jgi:hypothetical protein
MLLVVGTQLLVAQAASSCRRPPAPSPQPAARQAAQPASGHMEERAKKPAAGPEPNRPTSRSFVTSELLMAG